MCLVNFLSISGTKFVQRSDGRSVDGVVAVVGIRIRQVARPPEPRAVRTWKQKMKNPFVLPMMHAVLRSEFSRK